MAVNFIPSKKASLKAPVTVTATYNVWSDAINISGSGRLVTLLVSSQATSTTFYKVWIDEILIEDSSVASGGSGLNYYIGTGYKSADFKQYNASFSKSLRIEHYNNVFPVVGGCTIFYELE